MNAIRTKPRNDSARTNFPKEITKKINRKMQDKTKRVFHNMLKKSRLDEVTGEPQ
jgi:hypothetical protein